MNQENIIQELEKEAENGDVRASLALAELYWKKVESSELTLEKAYKWLMIARERGHPDAMEKLEDFLGFLYVSLHNLEVSKVKDSGPKAILMKAAEEDKILKAQFLMASACQNGVFKGSEKEASHWFRLGAEQEDPICQWNLAQCYFEGLGVEEDKNVALDWLKKSASRGFWKARVELKQWIGGSFLSRFLSLP